MGLQQRIDDDYVKALREGDTTKKDTLRLLRAALHNEAIERHGGLDDDAVIAVLGKQAKQRRDAAEQFEAGGRPELAEQELAELAIIESYLPAQLTDEEIEAEARAAIEASGASGPSDMGKVMGPLMKSLAGRADGKKVSSIVRRLLTE